jgi:hypothetical protein
MRYIRKFSGHATYIKICASSWSLAKVIKIVFYYKNGDKNFFLHSFIISYFFTQCMLFFRSDQYGDDWYRYEIYFQLCVRPAKTRRRPKSYENFAMKINIFWQVVNHCFMKKFRVLIYVKVVYVNNHYAAKKWNF